MQSIGVFTVATNRYIRYWQEMSKSFDHFAGSQYKCTFYVFTDQPNVAAETAMEFANGSIIVPIEIANLGWPDATIKRFELIESVLPDCNEDILMHLDADMLVHENFDPQFNSSNWKSNIFLVAHPGFYKEYLRRSKSRTLLALFQNKFRKAISAHAPIYPLGAWEDNEKSQAFVRPESRLVYVCGATWGGLRDQFKSMVRSLARQTREDRAHNVMAVWHDESHLNKWASENHFSLLSPNYCYAAPFSEDSGLRMIIQAVDKGSEATRS